MPDRGSMSLGLFPDMEEAEHRILEVGIPLMQLVYPKAIFFEETVFGLFDLKVTNPDPEARNARRSVEWFTGGDASIRFEIKNSKTGLGIAWVPDDPWMHNRIVLMEDASRETPSLSKMLKQIRLPDGNMKGGAEVLFELKSMELVLMDSVKIFKVFREDKEECWFPTKEEALAYIEDQGRTEVKLDVKTGTLQPMKIKKSHYSIKEGARAKWKPEIANLINQEKNKHRYGWTECKTFEDVWKPQIIKKIEENRENFNKANESASVKTAVSSIDNLSEEQLDAIARRISARKAGKLKEQKTGKEEVAA